MGMDVPVKLDDSGSHGSRDILAAHFVMDEDCEGQRRPTDSVP